MTQLPWFLSHKKANEQSHRGVGVGDRDRLRRDAGVLSAMVGTPPQSQYKTLDSGPFSNLEGNSEKSVFSKS